MTGGRGGAQTTGAPEITVIIPARDAGRTLPDTLDGLARQRGAPPFEVIVVDDGSRDETPMLAEGCEVVDLVVRTRGAGPAAARNAGAASARCTKMAFLDADCEPSPCWLCAGAAALEEADLVIGETRPRPDQPLGPFDRTLWVLGASALFESANLFVRAELFNRLGGFESWLGPRNGKELGEDVWFGWRARRCGARIAACRQALVHHAVHSRGAVGFIAERWRLRFFPALVRRIPELRRELLWGRVFLTARTASFDAAVVGLIAALRTRRPGYTLAALPYARLMGRDARGPWGRRRAVIYPVADGVGLLAMLWGSIRHRALLL